MNLEPDVGLKIATAVLRSRPDHSQGCLMAGADESEHTALPEQLRQQTDAYLLRCAKVNHIAQERDCKLVEDKLRNELLSNKLAFRNVKVKPHGFEVCLASCMQACAHDQCTMLSFALRAKSPPIPRKTRQCCPVVSYVVASERLPLDNALACDQLKPSASRSNSCWPGLPALGARACDGDVMKLG